MESILNMEDGEYHFKQTRMNGDSLETDSLNLITYTIADGKFKGRWEVTDRLGRVLETGSYRKGKKDGTWITRSYYTSEYERTSLAFEMELLNYRNGQLISRDINAEHKAFDKKKKEYQTIIWESFFEKLD